MLGVASLAILTAVALLFSSYYLGSSGNYDGSNSYYMNQAQLNLANDSYVNIVVDHSNSTLHATGSAYVSVLMGSMNGPSMYTFEFMGLYNPTIYATTATDLHLTLINIDTDSYHNFALSQNPPPYDFMTGMMQGNGLMYSTNYLPPVHSGSFAYINISYQFDAPGTYWYLCTYPGHAENGMYGKIVVT